MPDVERAVSCTDARKSYQNTQLLGLNVDMTACEITAKSVEFAGISSH
jgi:hypothetical protein